MAGGRRRLAPGIATADLSLRFDPAALRLDFGNGAGRTWLRLVLSATETRPRLRLRFDIVGEQHFYGLGQGGHGLDRLGTTRRLWNAHVNHGPGGDIAIPLLLSTAGYGLFFDNPRFALIDSGRTHDRVSFDYECDGDGFDLYFLGGGTLREALVDRRRAPRPAADAAALGARLHAVLAAFRRAGGGARAGDARSATRPSPAMR